MKKFKLNEKGFLDSNYNFEGIKKQYQDEIARAKSKLNEFQEGKDYTVSYEGQKKVYTIHSLQLKKVYWGDNIPEGFEYLIEEDNEGVRTRMKMILDLGTQTFYQGDNLHLQRSIEESSSRVPLDNHENVTEKIDFLKEELRKKEEYVQRLANYPEKQESVRVEMEDIKSSIRELTKKSSEKDDVEMTDAKNSKNEEINLSTRQDNHRKSGRGVNNSFVY